jgi:UDPglucose 6-dehydrogenase
VLLYKDMKIACIGTGFVGVVTAGVFAKLGHTVVGLDIDSKRVESLRQGIVPFYEPGLQELLVETQATGNLTFTTDYLSAIGGSDIVMIMVGTPTAPDGQADLKYVFMAADSLSPHLKMGGCRSQEHLPPGTNNKDRDHQSKDIYQL